MITIGLDIGTTGLKGIALDPQRGIVAQAARSSALSTPRAGWAEASTDEWMSNAIEVIAELAATVGPHNVAAIATTGMVPAVVLIDEEAAALRPAILQNDARAGAEVQTLAARLAGTGVLERTGSAVTQQSVGPTAMWLAEHEPDVWSRTTAIVGSYDWLLVALGARPHVETNWAHESGLMELDGSEFTPAVEAAGVAGRLAQVVRPGTVIGELSPSAAAATGLRPGVALVVGGADHVLSAYSAGLGAPGDWLVKLGGAGDILAVTETPVTDGRFYLDAHPMDGLWLPNGCMATSGSLVRWVQGILGNEDLAAMDAGAALRTPADVLCLPYFLGEKTPVNDPDLRGVFAGLHLGHDRYDLYRASLEGIAFGFRHNAEVLASRGIQLARARVTNGGATSPFWKTIHANVLGVSLGTVRNHPGASLGAAVAGAIGIGELDGWSDVSRFVAEGPTVEPEPALVERYDEAYAMWRELSDVTSTTMRALARR